MTSLVVIRGGLSGSMPVRGQSGMLPMRAAPHLKFIEHRGRGTFAVSAICQTEDIAPVRAAGVLGTIETETIQSPVARIRFQSVAGDPRRADAGALSVVLLIPPARLRRSFVCGLHGALAALQNSARRMADLFHFALSAGPSGLVAHCDGHTVERKEMTCPTR